MLDFYFNFEILKTMSMTCHFLSPVRNFILFFGKWNFFPLSTEQNSGMSLHLWLILNLPFFSPVQFITDCDWFVSTRGLWEILHYRLPYRSKFHIPESNFLCLYFYLLPCCSSYFSLILSSVKIILGLFHIIHLAGVL